MKSNKREECRTSKATGESYRDIIKRVPSPRDVWKDSDVLEEEAATEESDDSADTRDASDETRPASNK